MILSGQTAASIVMGSVIGFVLGTFVGVMLYYGLLKIPARYMLKSTSWLLMLLVAGLASQGAGYLCAAGYFSGLSAPVWDTSWLLSEDGIMGKSLHSLIGYSARPNTIQLLFYGATLGVLLGLTALAEYHHKKTLAAVAFALVLALPMRSAMALDEIYSPNTEYRELGVEYSGSRTFDDTHEKNAVYGHELALEYGFTPRITGEVSGSFEKEPDESLKMDSGEVEGRFQFFEQGENWVDSGLLVAYGFAAQSHEPDTLEVKLLLEKDIGRFTSKANIGFEQELGNLAVGGPDFVFLWSTRYRYCEQFQPGFEIQSDLGQDRTLGHFNEQEHYVGPAIYGRIFDHLHYEAAYLFGASTASSQGAARLLLEYEIPL